MTAANPALTFIPNPFIEGLAATLDRIVATLQRFIHFTSLDQAYAVALWIAHTWGIDRIRVSPRLAVRAPTMQSGKSRLMELLAHLTKGGWYITSPSEAVLFRKIERDQPTVLLDEVDRLFEKRAEDTAGIVGILNAGHARGAFVPRCVGPKQELRDFPVFAATAIAGIGTAWPDTLMDRSIVINLEKKTNAERVERLRDRTFDEIEPIGLELGDIVAKIQSFTLAETKIPEELSDRAQDSWESLLAIADAAGAEWPERARTAALALADAGKQGSEERTELRLLRDIRAIFKSLGDPETLRTDLVQIKLYSMTESGWADMYPPLTASRRGKLLRIFDIKTQQQGHGGAYVYRLADIERRWSRLGDGLDLPEVPSNDTDDEDDDTHSITDISPRTLFDVPA